MYNIPDKPADNVARRAAKLRVDKAKLAKIDDQYLKRAYKQELRLVDFENEEQRVAYLKEALKVKSEWNAARAKLGAPPSKQW
jgi:tellurite resistance protein